MNKEDAIAILEQRIGELERQKADPTVDPEMIQEGLEQFKDLLQRVKAGDEAAIQEVSDSWGP